MSEEDHMQELTIKETKEFIAALRLIALALAEGVKEKRALQATIDLLGNQEFRQKLALAVEDIERIPAELMDISAREGLKIAIDLIEIGDEVMEVLAA